ncbi:MAG: AraC family transcriptional regulator [Bacteroidales bacterium]|nr:AraC family transcriptional regulator [Bacteroidales bacterium]MCM1415917.1 AraC family transcriptional regulator [bacterium]MCM1422663.1 AraC family transcriptional regulator [bacterium]
MKKNLQSAFTPRQYMLSRDFEIFYYNDKNPNKVAFHTHDYYEFYFFLEGDVSIQIKREIYPLQFGDIMLIPPGTPHRLVIHDRNVRYRRFVLWISLSYYENLRGLSTDYAYLVRKAAKEKIYIFHNDRIAFNTIQTKIIRLLEEIHTERFGRKTQIPLCVDDLILHLNRVIYEQDHPYGESREAPLSERLPAYIEEHIGEELSLDRLAEVFFVSKYHIAHLFKENLGMSTHRYIMQKRLSLCREALLGGETISAVCASFGFGDYSAFYRAFRKEYGVSPKEFQKEHAGVYRAAD